MGWPHPDADPTVLSGTGWAGPERLHKAVSAPDRTSLQPFPRLSGGLSTAVLRSAPFHHRVNIPFPPALPINTGTSGVVQETRNYLLLLCEIGSSPQPCKELLVQEQISRSQQRLQRWVKFPWVKCLCFEQNSRRSCWPRAGSALC